LIPQSRIEEDNEQGGNLTKFTESINPSFNALLQKAHDFQELSDPDRVPINLLPYLARTYSIELEQILSDRAQRGFVRNPKKWMGIKGTPKGYAVRANISGFDVEVFALYRLASSIPALTAIGAEFEIPPGSGNLYTYIAPEIANYDEVPADVIPTDIYKFQFGGTLPEGIIFRDASDCTWCRTSKIRILISEKELDLQPDVTVSGALQSLVRKMEDVKPVHVQIVQVIYQLEFDVGVEVGVTVETFGDATSNEPVEV
jgi:hypothetical protein